MQLLGVWDLVGHTGPVYALECDQERKYLYSAGSDGIVALWSCITGKEALAVSRTPTAIYAMRYVPQTQTLFVGQTSGVIYALKPYEKKLLGAVQAHQAAVMGISSHPTDVEGWSTGKDGVFLYWDTDQAKPADRVLVSEAGLRGFVPLPTRRLFACAGRDGIAYIIERDSRQIIQRLIVENQPLFSIATAADESTLWIGGQSGWVYAWDVEDWTLRTAWQAHARAVNAIALHPAGQLIATASRDKQIYLWDVRSGKRLLTLAGHQRSVNALQWVDEGVLASAGDDGVIKVWHLEA